MLRRLFLMMAILLAFGALPHAHGAEIPSMVPALLSGGEAVTLFGVELGPTGQFLVKLLNFSIFAGVLVMVLRNVLRSAFRARAKELEERLGQSERERAEAEVQLQELQGKASVLRQELEEIMARTEAEAAAEKASLLAAAEAEAEAILAQARFEIETQQRHAEQELRVLVAELAVEGARERLKGRMAGAEAQSVMERAIARVGGE